MREARPIATEAGDRYTEADALIIEAMATTFIGPQDRASGLADDAVRMGREMESDRVVALGLLAGALAAMRLGRPNVSMRRLRSAVGMLQPPTRLDRLDAHLVTALTHLDRGTWNEVSQPAEELRSGVLANGWRLWEPLASLLSGRAWLAGGDVARAIPELTASVEVARSVGATGLLPIARALRDQALVLSGRTPRATAGRSSQGELGAIEAENRGLLALRAGDGPIAVDAFRDAGERWGDIGVSAWLARALSLQAQAERRVGNPRRSPRLAARARGVLDSLKTPAGVREPLLEPLGRPAS
jgi:hypothetical protein